MDYDKITYNGSTYAVIHIKYVDNVLPLVLDWGDLKAIKKLDKKWRYNKSGFVSCSHIYDGENKNIYIHDIIQSLNGGTNNIPTVHINRIGLDNRKENLMRDIANNPIGKNSKKKKRTIKLPKDSGILEQDIPTYIWYMKKNGAHGDRFFVDVAEHQWKTTSSKKVPLKQKLEDAKEYLRKLKLERPDIFEDHCMNGEFTKQGKELLQSYCAIIVLAGYNNIDCGNMNDTITDRYLEKI